MNEPSLKAVIFDVDGVLVDSLKNHLDFCTSRAAKHNLQIQIPTVDDFKKIIANGVVVSPMTQFFSALKFPADLIPELDRDYEMNFAKEFPSAMFPGVPEMIKTLRGYGIKLGLVTSNAKSNVDSALGVLITSFEASSIFYRDAALSKPNQLKLSIENLGIAPNYVVFVGDQPNDLSAARLVGCHFVGTIYGWAFSKDDQSFEAADSALAIPMAAHRAAIEYSNELRYDYAWKWFSYHADQRIKMFNYMFVGLSLFATALVGTFDKQLPRHVPAALCAIAALLGLIFFLIDGRNQFLLRLSEEILNDLEKRKIFGPSTWIADRKGKAIPLGIFIRQTYEDKKYKGCEAFYNVARGKHRFWLRAIIVLLALVFLIAGILIEIHGLPIPRK